jgi:hypothetical protein
MTTTDLLVYSPQRVRLGLPGGRLAWNFGTMLSWLDRLLPMIAAIRGGFPRIHILTLLSIDMI